MNTLRKNLPEPIPARILARPVSPKGYPVPYFVAKVNGEYDFRVIDTEKMKLCVKLRLCWICGDPLGRHMAFSIGPMCAVNRTSAEPPSHRECAQWSAKACPFLTLPHAVRREANMPLDGAPPAGIMLARNPGVTMVWLTASYEIIRDGTGVLFRIGEPLEILWFAEGRTATRAEIMHSIDTGVPTLRALAEKDDEYNGGRLATTRLARMVEKAKRLVPA